MKIRMAADALGVVEASIHGVREHILLFLICVVVIHYAFNLFAAKWKMVSSFLIKLKV